MRTQEERSELTRERILDSAKRIFARDGFEAAKLEEIASSAGYTRGAFYINFENKEELFVAVAGQQIANFNSLALGAVQSKSGIKPKIHELLQKMGDTADAQTWAMLMIEFGLFVLRHPKRKKHLSALYVQLLKGFETVFEDLYRESDRHPPLPLSVIGIGYYALVQGLALQEMLNSNLVTPKVRSQLLTIFLHAFLGNVSEQTPEA
jgi:AcrR family transcriptional regulator